MNSSSNSDAFRSLTKHDTYYISGADLCFLVENVHFRVHRFFFERESTYFVGKLATPASPGQQPQGTQDSNAILLEDVTAVHFAIFLWVFYNPRYSLYEASIADWEVILKLAVRWGFPEVKNLAVRELEKKEIPDAKRVKLYHENNVDRNILIPYYASLCERDAHLTYEEGVDLGMETVLMIAAGRQEARSPLSTGGRSPLSPTIRGVDLHGVVRELFKIVPEAPSPQNKDNTGGLSPQSKTLLPKKPMAPTARTPTLQLNLPRVKGGGSKVPTLTAAAAAEAESSDALRKASAVQTSDGVVAGITDDGGPFEPKVDATEGNTTTHGIGSTDDLLGLSFTGFNQTPSTTIPPPSLFGSLSTSTFSTPWSLEQF